MKGSAAATIWRNLDQARGTFWRFDRSGRVGEAGGEPVAHTKTSALHAEGASQSPVEAAHEDDDGYDFPPTAHPLRELFTASLFVLLIVALLVWGGWKLISLL